MTLILSKGESEQQTRDEGESDGRRVHANANGASPSANPAALCATLAHYSLALQSFEHREPLPVAHKCQQTRTVEKNWRWQRVMSRVCSF